MELWTMVLTGGVGAAAIKLLDHVIQWGLKRWEMCIRDRMRTSAPTPSPMAPRPRLPPRGSCQRS